MTDSSSNKDNEMAEMAGELLQAKMEASKFTHLLRVGTFQLEINPTSEVDVEKFFSETLDKLISAYGEKLLEIDIKTATVHGNMHG